jgi:hypothetical protein
MLPNALVFLDVDDLAEGKGAEYVDVSSLTLIFCSQGYFESANCVRELLRAAVTGKPLVTLLEPEVKHGGLSQHEVFQQLSEADSPCEKSGTMFPSRFAMWEMDKEVMNWGYKMLTGATLHNALFDEKPIEWNRIGTTCRRLELCNLAYFCEMSARHGVACHGC